jgi:hypothetical protein
VLRYGILALASRYDALKDDNPIDLESTFYHNRCLDLLIRALAQPPETYNPIILAAVVISRHYEELDVENDTQQHHLSGTRNLISHEAVARFAGSCDVAEAASWVHLRQAIYVCIVRSQLMEIPLKTFETFSAFRKDNDSSYANRAVYIFANILRQFFADRSENTSADRTDPVSNLESCKKWDALERDLTMWFDTKPLSFEPPYAEDPDVEAGRPFPFMWMVSTVSGTSARLS